MHQLKIWKFTQRAHQSSKTNLSSQTSRHICTLLSTRNRKQFTACAKSEKHLHRIERWPRWILEIVLETLVLLNFLRTKIELIWTRKRLLFRIVLGILKADWRDIADLGCEQLFKKLCFIEHASGELRRCRKLPIAVPLMFH